ncbi:MAG: hypothetical protein LBE05_04850 [Microbacterium sp.]|nr:hypothetical protein [Microbacterium sp.]
MRDLPRDIAKQTRQHTKRLVDAEWKRGLESRAATPIQRAVLSRTAVSSVTDRAVMLKSATKGRLSSGVPSEALASGAEFGADMNSYSRYQRTSRNGGSHTVTRRTTRQFGWHRGRTGRVVFPTAQDLAPRVAAMYVQTLLRTTAKALEN